MGKKQSKSYPNGSVWLQSGGQELTIIEFLGGNNFKVKFEDSPIFTAQAKEIKGGCVKNKNRRLLCNTGYIGYGDYSSATHLLAHQTWTDMIKRCYSDKSTQYKRYGGAGVSVCEDWHNFQNFAKWYEVTSIEGYRMDKDLLDYKAKMYSPQTCTFVPTHINALFTGGFKSIVYLRRDKWVVQLQKGEKCSNGRKRQSYFGEYVCKDEAIKVYFDAKYQHIQSVVGQFKETLDQRVVDNLLDREWMESYIYHLVDEANS